MEAIQNIILGIIGSLIAAFIFEIWHANSTWFPGPSIPPMPAEDSSPETDPRKQNRQRFKMAIFNGFFYLCTFFLVYQAISLPPILRALFSGQDLFLSDARYVGALLPQVPITKDVAQLRLLLLTVVVYVPSLFVVDFLAQVLRPLINKYWLIDIFVWRRIQIALFVLLAACLAITSIWLFYPLTIKDACMNFFGALAFGAIFLMGGKR